MADLEKKYRDITQNLEIGDAMWMIIVTEGMNKWHPNIGFTMEKKSNGEILFLGVKIIKKNNGIEFDIDRKRMSTQCAITRASNNTRQHKLKV